MSTRFPDDDPLAARLRAALSAEADMVQPGDDGLSSIRERTAARPWWRQPAAPAAAAAAALLLVAGGVALRAGGGEDATNGDVAAAQTTAPTSEAPSPTPSPSETPSTPPRFAGDVYVYYLSDDDGAPRLYRERHPGTGSSPAVAAVSAMLGQPAVDPDYASPWPSGTTLSSYAVAGGTATVNLSDFPRVGAAYEQAAVQQLVYTVTANDKSVSRVRLLVGGAAPPSGHQDWSQPVVRAPLADVQGLIWLLGPAQDASVSSPVEITGFGTAFEGTISWEVYADGGAGAKVAEGFAQGGSNGEFAGFQDSVDLPPGSYQIRAFEASAEDGSPIHVDTKTFTVR